MRPTGKWHEQFRIPSDPPEEIMKAVVAEVVEEMVAMEEASEAELSEWGLKQSQNPRTQARLSMLGMLLPTEVLETAMACMGRILHLTPESLETELERVRPLTGQVMALLNENNHHAKDVLLVCAIYLMACYQEAIGGEIKMRKIVARIGGIDRFNEECERRAAEKQKAKAFVKSPTPG